MMTQVQIQAQAQQRKRARQRTEGQSAGTATPVWTPQLGVQEAAYNSEADVIGYGGAAGGGKTDLQLGFAGTKHRRSIIFRRVFPSLRGMIERSREIFARGIDSHARDSYNEQTHVWRLTDKRMIEFGACQFEQDWKKHAGQARDFMGFDEATQFPEMVVRTLIGWNRTTVAGQPCRVLLTFNPPTDDSEEWVVSFFAPWLDDSYPDPADDGEIRYVARIENRDVFYRTPEDAPEDVRMVLKTRTFFHAALKDNPILEQMGYGATIEALPEPLRSLLKGNFTATRTVNPWQVIPRAWVVAAQNRWTEQQPVDPLTAVGIDVARGGNAQTILARLYGSWVAPLDKYPGAATPDGKSVAGLALPYAEARCGLHIDVIGVGSSGYDSMKDADMNVFPVNNAEAAPPGMRDRSKKMRFRNVRAASWWKFREALDPERGENLALPPDPELLADLCAPRWSLTSGGVLIESKEDIVERLGRSPDCGDAVVMAYWGLMTYYEPGI